MLWVLWVVGGKPSLFEGCLAVVLSCIKKEKKLRSSTTTTTDSIVDPSTLNIPHFHTQKKSTETYFFDKRSRLISNCKKKPKSIYLTFSSISSHCFNSLLEQERSLHLVYKFNWQFPFSFPSTLCCKGDGLCSSSKKKFN